MWLWGSSARSGVFVETPQYSLHTPPRSPSRDGGLTATKSETFIMLTSQTSVANSGVTGGERADSTQLPHPFVEYAENPVLRDTTSSNREDTMEQVFRQNFMDIVRREHLKQNPEYIVTSEHDVSRKPQDRNNRAIVVELDDEEEEERSPFKQSGQQQSSLYNLATDGTEAQSLTTKKEDSISPFVETVCALPTRAAAQACQSPLEAQMRTKGDGSTSPVPLPRVPRSSTCRLMSPPVAADAPIHILLLGSIQCGKSTLINAYRFAVTGSEAWAVSPSGRSGLRGTFRVRGYVAARSRRDADFLLIDTPGIALSEQRLRECSDLHPEEAMQIAGEDNKKRSSHRFELADPKMEHLLETLCDGMTFETDVARNYDQMDALDCTSVQNQVHHAFLVLSAKEILPESEVWGWKSWLKRVLIGSIPQNLLCTGHALDTAQTIGGAEPHPHVSSILKGTCALARWLEDRLYHAPYVIVTHMDVVGWYWKDAIFHTLREFVHESHITFLGLEQPHAYHEMPYAQRKTLQKLHERVMADIRWSVGNQ